MKNSTDLGGCYPPRPSASVNNSHLDLQNSSYPTRPYSIRLGVVPLSLSPSSVTRKKNGRVKSCCVKFERRGNISWFQVKFKFQVLLFYTVYRRDTT